MWQVTDKQQINASTLLQDTKRSEALGISYCATVKRQTSNSYLPHCSALWYSNPRNPFKTIKHQTMLVTMLFTKYGKKKEKKKSFTGCVDKGKDVIQEQNERFFDMTDVKILTKCITKNLATTFSKISFSAEEIRKQTSENKCVKSL